MQNAPQSTELKDIVTQSADPLIAPKTEVTAALLRAAVTDFLSTKDYKLIKHFEQSIVYSLNNASTEDLLHGVIRCIKSKYLAQVRIEETKYNQAPTLNQLFDAIDTLINVINTLDIKVDRNELAVALLGNTLKQVL